eukprot:714368_1
MKVAVKQILPRRFVSQLATGGIGILAGVSRPLALGQAGACEIHISLASREKRLLITDEFVLAIDPYGDTNNPAHKRARCLWHDLGSSDFFRDLFLVCQVYRIGNVHQSSSVTVDSRPVKRPLGCCIYHISETDAMMKLLRGREFSTPPMQLFEAEQETEFSLLFKLLMDGSSTSLVGIFRSKWNRACPSIRVHKICNITHSMCNRHIICPCRRPLRSTRKGSVVINPLDVGLGCVTPQTGEGCVSAV